MARTGGVCAGVRRCPWVLQVVGVRRCAQGSPASCRWQVCAGVRDASVRGRHVCERWLLGLNPRALSPACAGQGASGRDWSRPS